jgi:hypothetical protein
MSFWANVSGQWSLGKYLWANVVWANVGSPFSATLRLVTRGLTASRGLENALEKSPKFCYSSTSELKIEQRLMKKRPFIPPSLCEISQNVSKKNGPLQRSRTFSSVVELLCPPNGQIDAIHRVGELRPAAAAATKRKEYKKGSINLKKEWEQTNQ